MPDNNAPEFARRLKAVIDAAIDGIITINDRGIIEDFNQSAADIFGYSKDEVFGKNIKMLMPDNYAQAHDQYISNYLQTKIPKIIGIGREVSGLTKEGRVFPMRLAVSEVVLNDRIIFTGIVHDLTEFKKVQDDLKATNELLEAKVEERTQKLEEAINEMLKTNRRLEESETQLKVSLDKEKALNEMKSRFVSMASHEFRTPLSTIMSSVSLISKYTETDQNDKRLKHVNRIKSAVVNLTGILNDFLSLSKLEEGKIGVDKKEVQISALIFEVKEELMGMLKNGQEINISFEEALGTIVTDPRILKNVMFNLISNAIKYSEKEILVNVKNNKDMLLLSIQDFGVGIPESEQKFMFDRFFRASNVETIQGTGLGLNIVNRYVKLLNGKVNFTSIEGEGSTFYIEIPN